MKENCPSCQSQNIVSGRYHDHTALGAIPKFKPDGLKAFSMFGADVRIKNRGKFNCCLNCGHLWSKVDPNKLTEIITKHGTTKIKRSTGITE